LPEDDLALLVEAAQAAGELAMRHWRRDPEVWQKEEGQGPVSEADLAIDQLLHDRLRRARPSYGWLSEERDDDEARLGAEQVFIVDPIDGTRPFIRGEQSWAHSLAVVERGRVTSACVLMPARDLLFVAAAGRGARLNGAAITASPRREPAGATVLAPSASLEPALWPAGVPPVERHFRPSLAYRMCLVAQGRFDAMLSLRPTWEWDIAAGALICAEAGARVSDRHGEDLRFNGPTATTQGVVAAGAALHPSLVPS
jgi:myo-inositol-1(or 4)-monophosphatase